MAASLTKTRPAPDREARKQEALRLRQSNVSYRRIAAEVGVSVQTAFAWVQEGLTEMHKQTLEEAGKLQSLIASRLDDVSRRAYSLLAPSPHPDAVKPDGSPFMVPPDPDVVVRAIAEIRRCEMERAKLFGVVAPQRFEWELPNAEETIAAAVREEIASLPDDQLDQQLAAFQAGIAAAEEAASDKAAKGKRGKRVGAPTARTTRKL